MRRHTLEGSDAEVDMTPMLDIIFIMLIFFIVTTSFVKEQGLLVSKPKNSNPKAPTTPNIIVNISDTGIVRFNNTQVDIERLAARIESFLSNHDTTSAVVIADPATKMDDVVAVIDQIKSFNQLTVAIGGG
mgnify:CR=1 FL=1